MSQPVRRFRLSRSPLHCALLFGLGLGAPSASAQAPEPLKAVVWSADDAALKWAPCPMFLPKGCGIAVLQGDPAKPNVDVFFRVPAKTRLPLHWHSSAERMVLISGELQVTYSGQEPMTLRPGTYAYGPAKLAHEGFCASEVPCVLFIAFEAPLDAVPIELTKAPTGSTKQ